MMGIEPLEEPIDYKDPRKDIFKTVNVKEKRGGLEIKLVGNETSFDKMKEKQEHVGKDQIINGIRSKNGYGCSYLGISIFTSMTLGKDNYLLTITKPELADTNWPVCGFVRADQTPKSSLEEEVSEEILPVFDNPKLLLRFDFADKYYTNEFKDQKFGLSLLGEKHAKYITPGNFKKLVKYNGVGVEGDPHIYFDNSNKHAQVVFFRHIKTDVDLMTLDFSLNFAEDKFHPEEQNPAKKLYVHYFPGGVDLMKLDNGKLTDQVYNLVEGNLKEVNPGKIKLAEIFNIGEDCFAGERGIPLVEYVKKSFSK